MSFTVALPSGPRSAGPSKSHSHAKRTRVVRRRGRAANGLIESDEEIEREAASDSDSDDDRSLVESESESDSELSSDDVIAPDGRVLSVVTPSTTQSPAPHDTATKKQEREGDAFLAGAIDWSEMVADENRNGSSELPVIDFADLVAHSMDDQALDLQSVQPAQQSKNTDAVERPPSPPLTPPAQADTFADNAGAGLDEWETPVQDFPLGSRSRGASRGAYHPNRGGNGQTARQAYQRRLENDPSYVPVVGEFWGHDDRLLDKELRSLSGWWRGRWQGRGRGRGFGFPMRGRGRGGFFGRRPVDGMGGPDGMADPTGGEDNLPPSEREWTHDGFEELKQRDEEPRSFGGGEQQPHRGGGRGRGGFGSFRGGKGSGGGFVGRGGRGGGAGGFNRSLAPSPQPHAHATPAARPSPFLPENRTWFAMKPEPVWTKKHEAFLYLDGPAMRPRPGVGQGYRVKLPGSEDGGVIVRGPERLEFERQRVVPETHPSDKPDLDIVITVRLPSTLGTRVAAQSPASEAPLEESITTVDAPPVEAEVVEPEEPHLSAAQSDAVVEAATSAISSLSPDAEASPFKSTELSASSVPFTPARELQVPFEAPEPVSEPPTQESAPEPAAVNGDETNEEVPAEPEPTTEPPAEHSRPVLPPLQTVFSPAPQSSPPYGSPYAYAPALPPGIAVNQHGMTYEVATGRPVYLQAPLPPPPMYNPQPMMPAHMTMSPPMPFVPGHNPHHSLASPDFYSHSPAPSMGGMIDPATGAPLFTLPRQTTRVEIRAPGDPKNGQSAGKSGSSYPSGLRISLGPNGESHFNGMPAVQYSEQQQEPVNGANEGVPPQPSTVEPMMMGYNPYQQYYYPEQYGYPQYVDMSQMPPYEMYHPDPRVQPPVYY